ncbi:AraC family transcriptional regulator [Streptomyces varsoviensis]|uniref:AraC family transcriptional regulator n=1 Tax=Streptomyces varsoviensis TaxID=67373 RepID=UPI0007C5B7D7|nr:AraC family transcriptional regulator [Streptomyces varsoviensis]
MDTMAGLLGGPKARDAFMMKTVFHPPWSLRIEDRAPISVATMVRGDAWVYPDRARPCLLRPGDVALLRGPDAYTIADRPGTPVQIVVGPDQRCRTVADGKDVTESTALGVRTWGEAERAGASVMLSGTYQGPSEVGRRLLGALPALLVRPAGATDSPLVRLLADEIGKDEIGQGLVLDRLLDLLLVDVLRAWLAAPGSGAPGWYSAQADPVVGPALRLLHDRPADPWTVASLATAVGASRAGLARRFTELVGHPPMAYLAEWRVSLAADLLRDPDTTLETAAHRVGYSGAFALSAAFKRIRGMSPRHFREEGGEVSAQVRGGGVLGEGSSSGETVVLGA